jgi:CBS domain-containing protein
VVVDEDQAKQPVGIITETDIVQAVADGKACKEATRSGK